MAGADPPSDRPFTLPRACLTIALVIAGLGTVLALVTIALHYWPFAYLPTSPSIGFGW